jgi:hypothetical protein
MSAATFLPRLAEIRLSTILSLVDNPLCVVRLRGRGFVKMYRLTLIHTSVVE